MKENILSTGVFYEQLALDYFLAHIFIKEDEDYDEGYFYHRLIYKQQINGAGWQIDTSKFDSLLNPEGYQRDESVIILQPEETLLVDPIPPDIRITENENDGLIERKADNMTLEVFTRIMLKNGHYLVMIELHGYRIFDEFYIEINPANMVVVNYFESGMRF